MAKKRVDEVARKRYLDYLVRNGLKSTVQRDIIVNEFFRAVGHISADDLHSSLREDHSSIGLATVYRTMKILVEAGLAHERRFNDGFARYEYCGPNDSHHDHLVCDECGKVEEFENDEIERLQSEVAIAYKFTITSHKMELYGMCYECSNKK